MGTYRDTEIINTDSRLVVARVGVEMDKGSQKVQTSSCKIN